MTRLRKMYIFFLCSETRMFFLRGSVQTDETQKLFLSKELLRE